MLAAPIFLGLSKAGKLACDVWLVHLTGEEFPADCLGARHLTQALVEGDLRVREQGGGERDLSGVRVQGVYVSDMIAHNNDRDRDVFQIAPGTGAASAWLALQAHLANVAWNALARKRNAQPPRKALRRGRRVARGIKPPAMARMPVLRGEVRPVWDPRRVRPLNDVRINVSFQWGNHSDQSWPRTVPIVLGCTTTSAN
jgi:hypothetical protein